MFGSASIRPPLFCHMFARGEMRVLRTCHCHTLCLARPSQVTPKANRSLRATRRTPDDCADELARSDGGVAARRVPGMIALASDISRGRYRYEGVAQRILRRERVHCPHQQVTCAGAKYYVFSRGVASRTPELEPITSTVKPAGCDKRINADVAAVVPIHTNIMIQRFFLCQLVTCRLLINTKLRHLLIRLLSEVVWLLMCLFSSLSKAVYFGRHGNILCSRTSLKQPVLGASPKVKQGQGV